MPLDQIEDMDKFLEGEKSQDKEMGFLDHLEELRWHLMRSFGAILILAIVVFLFKDFVFNEIIFGPRNDDFLTYRVICWISNTVGLGDRMCFTPVQFDLQIVEFGEAFLLHLKASVILGFIIAFPYIFWEIWSFIKPGLYDEEQKTVRGIVFICSFLFMIGIGFGYYIISPFAVNFLAGYTLPGVGNDPRVGSYVNYMTMFVLPAGVVFELPIVVYFLAKVDLITSNFMKQYRKHSVVVILIFAAIITPPDAVTQVMIGFPVYFLYEISILIAARVEREKRRALEN